MTDLAAALDFARANPRGVLVTLKRDGRPQTSNIMFVVGEDGLIRISVTAPRAKTRNAARDPRVSLHINQDDFGAYVVIEGDAELSPVSTEPGDAVGQELAEMYRAMQGEHTDWDEYFAAMVADQRLVLRIHPTHAYGMLPQ